MHQFQVLRFKFRHILLKKFQPILRISAQHDRVTPPAHGPHIIRFILHREISSPCSLNILQGCLLYTSGSAPPRALIWKNPRPAARHPPDALSSPGKEIRSISLCFSRSASSLSAIYTRSSSSGAKMCIRDRYRESFSPSKKTQGQ